MLHHIWFYLLLLTCTSNLNCKLGFSILCFELFLFYFWIVNGCNFSGWTEIKLRQFSSPLFFPTNPFRPQPSLSSNFSDQPNKLFKGLFLAPLSIRINTWKLQTFQSLLSLVIILTYDNKSWEVQRSYECIVTFSKERNGICCSEDCGRQMEN